VTRKVIWTAPARIEYLEHINYIARDSPTAAERVARRLDRAAEQLGFMSTGRPGRVAGTREKVVTGLPYILIYKIVPSPEGEETEETIAILNVIHGAQRWPREK
jgi:plasmid stabilization system protein ParE